MMKWFEVDRRGLCEIAKRRGMAFIVIEPVQNSWDENTSRVEVTLEAVPNTPRVDITVRDDSPDGFRDLGDSYMMFRQSYKLDNPEQRGRFNLGEKLLLAMAESARITSTTGSVIFDDKGRRRGRKRTERGSVLTARLRMTRAEMDEALRFAETLIPPPGILTVVNGNNLPQREPLTSAERTLETEILGEQGGFKYTTRKTVMHLYQPLGGEDAHLYEMGIPIDKIGCPWHVSVEQKVPLSMDRASVRYGYKQKIEQYAAEIMADQLSEEQARESWVAAALGNTDDDRAVKSIIRKRFGKAVTYDPSSPESAKRALDAGYHVVRGGELSASAWASVRRAQALQPAGKVFQVGLATSPDGVRPEPEESWTDRMHDVARYAADFVRHALGAEVEMAINFYKLSGRSDVAGFCGGREIGFNLSNGKTKMIMHDPLLWQESLDELLIHECAHVKAKDHLTDEFHQECCRIGARLRTFYNHPGMG